MTCRSDVPKLSDPDIADRLARMAGWSRVDTWIEKTFVFNNFLRAMSFVNAVAYIAESINHHPDIIVRYNKVTLRNWTHAVDAITDYDFELAAKIESISLE